MNRHCSRPALPVVLCVLFAIGLLTGCAARQGIWGDPRTGLILTYRMTEDQSLKYRTELGQVQSMDAMGRSRGFGTDTTIEFSVTSPGSSEDNQQLTVTIDSMNVELDTPRGEITRVVGEVLGKSFGMILSPQGEKLDLSEAERVRYNLPPMGERSVASDFRALFPNLAGKPLRVGDSWTSTDSFTEASINGNPTINLEIVSTLEGFETIDGMECAKIAVTITGTVEGTASFGAQMSNVEGSVEGSGAWYFAYRKGLLVKMDTSFRGTSHVTGGQRVSISHETTIATRLLR